MLTMPLAFLFESFLIFLVWGLLALLNVWMFQKTKGQGNLLMLIGAGLLSLSALLLSFMIPTSAFIPFWVPFIGAVLLLIGFYFTAKPIVDQHLQGLKKKLNEMTSEKKGDVPAESTKGEGDA